MTSVGKFPRTSSGLPARAHAILADILRHMAPLAGATLLAMTGICATAAQDASNWDATAHSATRLIAGGISKSRDAAFLRAGIEIKLEPGWKTYWRDPGDSGAPPNFDFSGSENVKAVNVLWPAPQRFPDGAGGNSIGYTNHLILPLHVVAADAARQTALRVKLEYDICANICIPVQVDLSLPLAGDGAEEATIERAEVRVPRRVALGPARRAEAMQPRDQSPTAMSSDSPSRDALAVLAVHRQPGDAHDRVLVDVAAPTGTAVDLFVEGPTPDWSLPLPEQTGTNGTIRQFVFDLEGLPPDAEADGATLTLTAVTSDDAIEVTTHLD